jgi:hypothetical protein
MRAVPSGAQGSFAMVVAPEHLANRFKDATLPAVGWGRGDWTRHSRKDRRRPGQVFRAVVLQDRSLRGPIIAQRVAACRTPPSSSSSRVSPFRLHLAPGDFVHHAKGFVVGRVLCAGES